MTWEEFLWHLDQRLGLYVGLPRYERAFAALTGFALARGRDELAAFQRWLSDRHHGSPLTFSLLVLAETFGEGATEDRLASDTDHRQAVSTLCRLFKEFLGQEALTAGPIGPGLRPGGLGRAGPPTHVRTPEERASEGPHPMPRLMPWRRADQDEQHGVPPGADG
ncbi:hypothetical protein ACQPWW_20660 [Micromonospora sp. CA-240977]|uniref:hypothetical protein n=1 Tax=Micromonospora sp. CA-240977 TaxID=3239957 RepID=UPI003D8D269B